MDIIALRLKVCLVAFVYRYIPQTEEIYICHGTLFLLDIVLICNYLNSTLVN